MVKPSISTGLLQHVALIRILEKQKSPNLLKNGQKCHIFENPIVGIWPESDDMWPEGPLSPQVFSQFSYPKWIKIRDFI